MMRGLALGLAVVGALASCRHGGPRPTSQARAAGGATSAAAAPAQAASEIREARIAEIARAAEFAGTILIARGDQIVFEQAFTQRYWWFVRRYLYFHFLKSHLLTRFCP
jgi:hypothetical protein